MSCSQIYYINKDDYEKGKQLNDTFSNLSSRKDILMKSLSSFYENKDKYNKFYEIVSGNSNLSLRIIDWFVTNYAKENKVCYDLVNGNGKFLVYLGYKAQLRSYSKKQFDPFCRSKRIMLFIDFGNKNLTEPLETTVGQLNFFRWAISNGVISYIENHLSEIEIHMNKGNTKNKRKSNASKKKDSIDATVSICPSDKKIGVSATKRVNKHNVVITVEFN